jgi:hypothetical protein
MLGFVVFLNQLCSLRSNLLKRRDEKDPDQLHKRQKSLLLKGIGELGVSLRAGWDA